ncbi:hypothetical protein BJ742DRAFT_867856 [Cladochytrium replicatum]|nr:hypothetical protein BJ742DRAFT_867856 [Cladochytrium replicatum]
MYCTMQLTPTAVPTKRLSVITFASAQSMARAMKTAAFLEPFVAEPEIREMRALLDFDASRFRLPGKTLLHMQKGDVLTVFGSSEHGDYYYGAKKDSDDIGWVQSAILVNCVEQSIQNGLERISYTTQFPSLLQHSGSTSVSSSQITRTFASPMSVMATSTTGSNGAVAVNPIAFPHMGSSSSKIPNSVNLKSIRMWNTATNRSLEGMRHEQSGGAAPKSRTKEGRISEKNLIREHIEVKKGQKRHPFGAKGHPETLDMLMEILDDINHKDGSVKAVFNDRAMAKARQKLRDFSPNEREEWRIWVKTPIRKHRFDKLRRKSAQENDSRSHFLELLLMLNTTPSFERDQLFEMHPVVALSSRENTGEISSPPVVASDSSVSPMLQNSDPHSPQSTYPQIAHQTIFQQLPAQRVSVPQVPWIPISVVSNNSTQFVPAVDPTAPWQYMQLGGNSPDPSDVSPADLFPPCINPRSRDVPLKKGKRGNGMSWIKKRAQRIMDNMMKKASAKTEKASDQNVDMPAPVLSSNPPIKRDSEEHGMVPDTEHINEQAIDSTNYPKLHSIDQLVSSITTVLRAAVIEQSQISKHDQNATMELVSECTEAICNIFLDLDVVEVDPTERTATLLRTFIDSTLTNSNCLRLFSRVIKTIEATKVVSDINSTLSEHVIAGINAEGSPTELAKVFCAAKLFGEVYAVSAEMEIEDEDDEATYVEVFSLDELEGFNRVFEALVSTVEAKENENAVVFASEILRVLFLAARRRLEWEVGNSMSENDEEALSLNSPKTGLENEGETSSAAEPSVISQVSSLNERPATLKRTRTTQRAQNAQNIFDQIFGRLCVLAGSPSISLSIRIRLRDTIELLPKVEYKISEKEPATRQQVFNRAVRKISALRYIKIVGDSGVAVSSEDIPDYTYVLNRILVQWWDRRDVNTILDTARVFGKLFPNAAFLDWIFNPFTMPSEFVDTSVLADVCELVAALRAEGVMTRAAVVTALERLLAAWESEDKIDDEEGVGEPAFVSLLSELVDLGVVSMGDMVSLDKLYVESNSDEADDEVSEYSIRNLPLGEETEDVGVCLADQMANLNVL